MTKTLLIIGYVWPEPNSSAAGSRMLQLIEQFKRQNFQITFACAARKSENAVDLKIFDVDIRSIALNDASFDHFIAKLNPEVVLFDRFMIEEQFGWRVAEHCPDALRILDTEDFHGLRAGREMAVKAGKAFNFDDLLNTKTLRELASIYRSDLSLIISEIEMDILTDTLGVPSYLLHYLPFLIDTDLTLNSEKLPAFNDRSDFVTVGNFLHPPNYDAVVYLKQQIWPLIKSSLPKAKLHVYGAYVPQKALQLSNAQSGFFIKGYTEDINTVMQNARLCLAPLRFGAGLKGKLVDAMRNGTPCIMSPIAAEGMFGPLNPNGFISDNPKDFTEAAVMLYLNENQWQLMQKNGFEVLKKRFDKTKFKHPLTLAIKELQEDIKKHRQKNIVGKIVNHETLRSTKYMSKWIEEKNN